ncbi:PH domain-containing protein [Candidatus Woesearchaeota archaeon]|nr:PH domain-containing protein [Candidatus Woesearchaeota archaeon]
MVMPQQNYVLSQNQKRVLVPKALLLMFLTGLFYFFVLLNIWLALELKLLRMKPPIAVHIIVLLLLGVFAAIQMVLDVRRLHQRQYLFSEESVSKTGHNQFMIPYTNIVSMIVKRNVIDRLFGTGSIVLNSKFVIRSVDHVDDVYRYLRGLVDHKNAAYQPIPVRDAHIQV